MATTGTGTGATGAAGCARRLSISAARRRISSTRFGRGSAASAPEARSQYTGDRDTFCEKFCENRGTS
jgi:hypothetical protein